MSWTVKRLPIGEVCTLVNGRAFKPTDWTETGTPIVRIQNLNDLTKPFNCYLGEVADKHIVNSGDILLSWSGTPGTSFGCFIWSRGRAILNQHIFRVHVHDSIVDKNYFVYVVNGHLDEMIALAHGGVGLRHITKGKLESIEVPIPPLSEQRRIVARIQELMSRADEIRRLREENLTAATALLPSLLKDVFGDVASQHKSSSIEELALETRYGTSEKCDPAYTGTPVLRIPNVAGGHVNFDNLKYLPRPIAADDQVALREGDLLIVRTNGSPDLVGRCAVVPLLHTSFAYASYLIRVRLDTRKVLPKFASFYLTSTSGRDQIAACRHTSAGQFNINTQDIRSITIPLPPRAVQAQLVQKMQEIEMVSQQMHNELQESLEHDRQLPTAILRKAFAGEL